MLRITLLAAILLTSCGASQTDEALVDMQNKIEALEKQNEQLIDDISNTNNVPSNGSATPNEAVHGFYTALVSGDGNKAVSFVIPEKQETGNYTSAGISDYYGSLEIPVNIKNLDPVSNTQIRVAYQYKESGKVECIDIMDVYTVERSTGWFIEKIIPRQTCKAIEVAPEPVQQPVRVDSSEKVERSISCQKFGRENYQDSLFSDGSIEFEFYYSPKLDTCLLEREEFGPAPDDYVLRLYLLFEKDLLVHYSNAGSEFCVGAKITGVAPNAQCVPSLAEYKQWKQILTE